MGIELYFGNAKDPLTGETFTKKRNNQKFATRQNQVRFNNLIARKKRAAKSPVNRILDRNHLVLSWILGNEKEATRSKDFLHGAGYQFTHYTNKIPHEKSHTKQAAVVYDIKIYPIDDNRNFKIFK